ncbi:MAG TPA: PilN domain-containing protein [Vicinamibacterales bacterium]|jgi:type IV pilus assembly protein PilN
MIRINLLAVERAVAKKPRSSFSLSNQKLTIGCALIFIGSAALVGWRYVALSRESTRLDEEISAAQQETARLHGIIQQVQQFEQRKAQLQQRVQLIEQLRKGQTGPVHMLDQVSRALPSMLWLTELKQNDKVPGEVTIDGRCTTLTGLSDFVANLEASGFFKKSIEIVSTVAEPLTQPPGELIKFSIRAQFQTPGEAKPAAPTPRAGGD